MSRGLTYPILPATRETSAGPRPPAAPRTGPAPDAGVGGFSLIELLIVVAIIGIIAAIAIPNLLASRRAANEAAAVSTIRSFSSTEEAYRATYGAGVRFASLGELESKQMIDHALASATPVGSPKDGYVFNISLYDTDLSYCAGGAPATPYTGTRNFSTDTPGVIYVHALDVANPPATTAGGTPMRD